MADLRRVGNRMEAIRTPFGSRVLLPFEKELCETVGLTEEEYWWFVKKTLSYNGKRSEAYDHIPYIVNMPQALFVGGVASAGLTLFGQIVVGLVLTGISYLLTPKPKPVKGPGANITTASNNNARRFAPTQGWTFQQELATIGDPIPIVFARYGRVSYWVPGLPGSPDNYSKAYLGGVRVQPALVWSQLKSLGNSQQLRAIFAVSSLSRIDNDDSKILGLGDSPEFSSFAIGETTFENYTQAKIALYFMTEGGRAKGNGTERYSEGTLDDTDNIQDLKDDAFRIPWDKQLKTVDGKEVVNYKPYFSGSKPPRIQTKFGLFSPLSNGNGIKLNFEYVFEQRGIDGDAIPVLGMKKAKLLKRWTRWCSVVDTNGNVPAIHSDVTMSEDNQFRYKIASNYSFNKDVGYSSLMPKLGEGNSKDHFANAYEPHGVEDVVGMVDSLRENADDNISMGELYMAGTTFAICSRSDINDQLSGNRRWASNNRIVKESLYTVKDMNLKEPDGASASKYFNKIDYRNPEAVEIPGSTYPLQRVNAGGISNTRACHVTEIGLKSVVYQLINGMQNVASMPTESGWATIYNGRGSLSLGGINTYVKRYSFFRLFARKIGRKFNAVKDSPWVDISHGQKHFCVMGRSPEPQYNFIRITQPEDTVQQYEYKFVPIPGAYVKRHNMNQEVEMLSSDGHLNTYNVKVGDGSYIVSFKGMQVKLTPNEVSNKEYIVSGKEDSTTENDYVIPTGSKHNGWPIQVDSNGEAYRDSHGNDRWHCAQSNAYLYQYNINPYDAISDISLYDSIQLSNDTNPEHEIVYCNEQIKPDTHDSSIPYTQLANTGLVMNASKEWNAFAQISCFIKNGVKVKRLIKEDGKPVITDETPYATYYESTNNFAEIAYTMLTDSDLGAGKLIGAKGVSKDGMTKAAQFCYENNFTWDGVIADKQNLRDWLFQNAQYNLLDFTVEGGLLSLKPTVPNNRQTSSISALNRIAIEVKALFTDGNIQKDSLKVSFLTPEERQMFTAVVLWRENHLNHFPQTKVIRIRLAGPNDAGKTDQGGNELDVDETYDLTGFCTRKDHALKYAKYILKTRKEVDHGLSFKTTPEAVLGLTPGDYFRLVSEATHTERFQNGTISSTGIVQSSKSDDFTDQPIMYWKAGTEKEVQSGNLTTVNGKAQEGSLYGSVFTVADNVVTNRIYKCESIAYGEEGLIEIAGSHCPVNADGVGGKVDNTPKVLEWDDSHFVIEDV